MRALLTVSILLLAAFVRPSCGDDPLREFEIVRFTKGSSHKVWFGSGSADGYLGDNWAITNLTAKPFSLEAVNQETRLQYRLSREGGMFFRANPRWTATLKNKTTGDESTLSISDRIECTTHLGTNDYFIVDIRISSQEVLLKHTLTGEMTTIRDTATNGTERVEPSIAR